MKNKEPTKPTPEEIEKQIEEFGEVLGFDKEKFVELANKKCKMCDNCKCKTPKDND